MPDSTAFYDEENKVDSLDLNERGRLAQMISNRFSRATSEIKELIEDSKEGWDFYLKNHPQLPQLPVRKEAKLSMDQRNHKGLRLGLIPRSIDSVMSVLHNSLFPADERFFRGTPKNDVALRYQELLETYLAEAFAEDNTTEEFRKMLLTMCIDPAACIAVPWKQKKRKKVVYEPPTIQMGGIKIPLPVLGLKKKVVKDYVEWEGTKAECLDFNDFRVDPSAKCMDESWFIRRWYEPTWKVKRDYNLKEVKPYHSIGELESDPDGNQKRESSGLNLPIPFESEPDGKEEALLMVCYDTFVIDGEVYENHVAVTLNGQELIWFGENPYMHGRIPYIVTSLLPIPNQVYGLSLIKHAIPSAAVVDTVVDKILKIANLAAQPIFEVDMTEPSLRKTTKIVAGMTIPTKRPNAIRQVPVSITNLSILETIIEKAEANIREVTGASPVFTGEDFNSQPANITAFQVDQHVQGANSRFQAIMKNFCNSVLEPFLFISMENMKQFKEKTEYVAVGDDTRELTPDLIRQMDFKWIITSANASNTRGKRLANLRSLLMEVMPPLVQNGIVQLSPEPLVADQRVLLRDLLVLGGIPNADEIIKPVPAASPMPMSPLEGLMNGSQPPLPGGAGQPPGNPQRAPSVPAA